MSELLRRQLQLFERRMPEKYICEHERSLEQIRKPGRETTNLTLFALLSGFMLYTLRIQVSSLRYGRFDNLKVLSVLP